MNIKLQVNGCEKEVNLEEVPHLAALVDLLAKTDKGLIAEVNETIVYRHDWQHYHLKAGDTIELISLVGGG